MEVINRQHIFFMPTKLPKGELSPNAKAFLKTLPANYGDNWEDDLRREYEKGRRRIDEDLPTLNELIDLNYPDKEMPFTQAFLNCQSSEEIKAVLQSGVKWINS
jgi:hypothetical protein